MREKSVRISKGAADPVNALARDYERLPLTPPKPHGSNRRPRAMPTWTVGGKE